jgi:hypothetical protein
MKILMVVMLVLFLCQKTVLAQPELVCRIETNIPKRVTFQEIGILNPDELPLPEKFALTLVTVTNEFGKGASLLGVFQEIPHGVTFEKMYVTLDNDVVFFYRDATGKSYATKIEGERLGKYTSQIWQKERWDGPVHLYFEKKIQLDIYRSSPSPK